MRLTVTPFFNTTMLPATRRHGEGWEPSKRRNFLGSYQTGDRLYQSQHRFDFVTDGNVLAACNAAFAAFNHDDRINGQTERSLSAGDIVHVQDQDGHELGWFECTLDGWDEIQYPPPDSIEWSIPA
jgi:hypothetical protein